MTEETAAQQAKRAAEDRAASGEAKKPAPIDQRTRQARRPSSLPRALRTTPGMDPRLFDSVREELSNNPACKGLFDTASETLQAASNVIEDVADAEDQIVENHNKMIAAGTATGHVQLVNGRPRAIPGKLEELAELADTRLGAAIEKLHSRIATHNKHMLGLVELMDKATYHVDTARDQTLMGQVRSYIANMSKAEAKSFVVKSALDGQREVIHTVLHTPAFLSGLDDDAVADVYRAARRTLTPDLLKAFETGEKMDQAFMVAGNLLEKKRKVLASYRHAGEKAATDALTKLRTG